MMSYLEKITIGPGPTFKALGEALAARYCRYSAVRNPCIAGLRNFAASKMLHCK
jgi:hypothetical protein